MEKVAILDLARQKGLSEHVDTVENALKPSIGLTLEPADEGPLGASRFGGQPNLRKGTAWPTWQDVPMEFVGQSAWPTSHRTNAERLLPPTGQLYFFRSSQ